MVSEPSGAAQSNRDFLNTYLEFGLGHYYTLARTLTGRGVDDLSGSEKISVGIEVSSLAGAALDNTVRWYMMLRHWKPRTQQVLLSDMLANARITDAHRDDVLNHVTASRTDEFCQAFRIPWAGEDIRARGIDVSNWRFTVDRAKINISKVMEDLATGGQATQRDWITHYLSAGTHGFLADTGELDPASVVRVGGEEPSNNGTDSLTIPTDKGTLQALTDLTGNAAIGLFCLIRLMYVTAYGTEPRSPSFVVIWQQMHPSKGAGP